jgi:peptide chain release factor 1
MVAAAAAVAGAMACLLCMACCAAQVSELRDSLLLALIPPDSAEGANVVLELRASVGGDWVAGFTEDLLDMYRRFAAEQGWRFEVSAPTWGSAAGS